MDAAERVESARRAAVAAVQEDGWADASASTEIAVCVFSADGNSAYVEVAVDEEEPRREEVLLEWLEQDQTWEALSSGQTGLLWTSQALSRRARRREARREGPRLGTLRCALFVEGDAADATVTFAGREYLAPVADRYCLFVAYDVPEELSKEWPPLLSAS